MAHSHDHHGHSHGHDHGHDHGGDSVDIYRDPAQQSLSSALGLGFFVLRLIMIAVVVLYIASGWFQVNPGEQGLVARFGQLRAAPDQGKVFEPGSYWALPDPFDEKIRLTGESIPLRTSSFVPFEQRGKDLIDENASYKDQLQPGKDGAMLTGDRSLCHGVWTVDYRIQNGEAFVTTVGEEASSADQISKAATSRNWREQTSAEAMIERLLDAAVTRTVASHTVEGVRGEEISTITARVEERLNRQLGDEGLNTGIVVTKVTLRPFLPAKVNEAFIRVTQARSARSQALHEAETVRNKALSEAAGRRADDILGAIRAYDESQRLGEAPEHQAELREAIDDQLDLAKDESQGQVAVLLRAAEARANQHREQIRSEYEQFTKYLTLYERDPKATLLGLWTDMRGQVLGSVANEVFFVPRTDVLEIITNRDEAKRLRAENE
ncbi:MAG: hypothetical protein KDA32_10405, partial [Phycisphaerales bacterium]|nr:hypothetical protein [Phycisphaerales bacterium]